MYLAGPGGASIRRKLLTTECLLLKKIEQSMSQQTQNIFIPFVQRRLTMSSTLVQLCTNVIYIFCVHWGLIQTTHKQQ